MVFRRENKVDAFQRQMNALRNQIGAEPSDDEYVEPHQSDDGYDDAASYDQGDAGEYSFGSYPPSNSGETQQYDNTSSPSVPDMPGVDSQISVVAQGTVYKGDIQSDGSVQIYGRAEGTITAKEDVWLAEGSEVDATVTARRVVVGGRINGEIRALSRFEALPQGVVEADVQAPSFVVHEGATINGKLTMSQNDHQVSSGRAERNGSAGLISRRPRMSNSSMG